MSDRPVSVSINGYFIDAAISEQHNDKSEVTQHPVEGGSNISDHVRNLPSEISLDCVVSDNPLEPLASLRTGVPTEDMLARLEAMRLAREPVEIITLRKSYPSMLCTGVSRVENASTGAVLRFTATFQAIEIITNERTIVKVAVPRAARKTNLGNKPTKPVEPSTKGAPEANKSMAADLVDFVGSQF